MNLPREEHFVSITVADVTVYMRPKVLQVVSGSIMTSMAPKTPMTASEVNFVTKYVTMGK